MEKNNFRLWQTSWLKLWITWITPHSILQSNEHTGSADGTRVVLHSNVCWLLLTLPAFPNDAFPNFNTYKTFSWVLKKAEVVCISHKALIESRVLIVTPCCFESFTEWLTYKRPKPLTAAEKAPKNNQRTHNRNTWPLSGARRSRFIVKTSPTTLTRWRVLHAILSSDYRARQTQKPN